MDDEFRRILYDHARAGELLAMHWCSDRWHRWSVTISLMLLVLLAAVFVFRQTGFQQEQLRLLKELASKPSDRGTMDSVVQGVAEGLAEGVVKTVGETGDRRQSLAREAMLAAIKGFTGKAGEMSLEALVDAVFPANAEGTPKPERQTESKPRPSRPGVHKPEPGSGSPRARKPQGRTPVTPKLGSGADCRQETEVIRAHRLELVDVTGRTCVVLGLTHDGTLEVRVAAGESRPVALLARPEPPAALLTGGR
jgi:hypothetical protein